MMSSSGSSCGSSKSGYRFKPIIIDEQMDYNYSNALFYFSNPKLTLMGE